MAKQKCAKCTINDNLTYQIDRLTEENAELKAKLEKAVELPCKVGDMIYYLTYDNSIVEGKVYVVHLSLHEKYGFDFTIHIPPDYCITNCAFNKNRIFLTKEAAEQALKGGKESE